MPLSVSLPGAKQPPATPPLRSAVDSLARQNRLPAGSISQLHQLVNTTFHLRPSMQAGYAAAAAPAAGGGFSALLLQVEGARMSVAAMPRCMIRTVLDAELGGIQRETLAAVRHWEHELRTAARANNQARVDVAASLLGRDNPWVRKYGQPRTLVSAVHAHKNVRCIAEWSHQAMVELAQSRSHYHLAMASPSAGMHDAAERPVTAPVISLGDALAEVRDAMQATGQIQHDQARRDMHATLSEIERDTMTAIHYWRLALEDPSLHRFPGRADVAIHWLGARDPVVQRHASRPQAVPIGIDEVLAVPCDEMTAVHAVRLQLERCELSSATLASFTAVLEGRFQQLVLSARDPAAGLTAIHDELRAARDTAQHLPLATSRHAISARIHSMMKRVESAVVLRHTAVDVASGAPGEARLR